MQQHTTHKRSVLLLLRHSMYSCCSVWTEHRNGHFDAEEATIIDVIRLHQLPQFEPVC